MACLSGDDTAAPIIHIIILHMTFGAGEKEGLRQYELTE